MGVPPAPTPTASALGARSGGLVAGQVHIHNSVTQEPTLMELVRQIAEPVDLIITRLKEDAPKIEVWHRVGAERRTGMCRRRAGGHPSSQVFPSYPSAIWRLTTSVACANLVEQRILAQVASVRAVSVAGQGSAQMNSLQARKRRLSPSCGHRPVCNYRCVSACRLEGAPFKPHEDMLTCEDMAFVGVAVQTGHKEGAAHRGRTAGARRRWPCSRPYPGPGASRFTTNGVLLPCPPKSSKPRAGPVNISLDSLDPERYKQLTRGATCRLCWRGWRRRSVRAEPREAQRVHDSRVAAELPAFVELHPRATPTCALHRVDAGGRMQGRALGEPLSKGDLLAALQKLERSGAPGGLEPVARRSLAGSSPVMRVRWGFMGRPL